MLPFLLKTSYLYNNIVNMYIFSYLEVATAIILTKCLAKPYASGDTWVCPAILRSYLYSWNISVACCVPGLAVCLFTCQVTVTIITIITIIITIDDDKDDDDILIIGILSLLSSLLLLVL